MVQRMIPATLSALFYLSIFIPQCALAGWKVPFDGSNSEPVVHNGVIYVGSFDGAIYAIDPQNGKQIWRYQTGVGLTSGPEIIRTPGKTFEEQLGAALETIGKKGKGKREIDATPVIEDDKVYVGSKDHSFYALDARTGELRWATNIFHPIFREALVTKENIIVHGIGMALSPNVIYVLHKKDGRVVWSTEAKGSVTYPSVNGGVIYYGLSKDKETSSSFFLNAAEVMTGNILWTRELQGRRPESTYYSEPGVVYVTAFEGGEFIHLPNNTVTLAPTTTHVYAVNASTGTLVWKFKGGEVVSHSSPQLVVGPKDIYFVIKEGLYAVEKNTGKQSWFLEGKYSPHELKHFDNVLYVHGDSTRKDNHLYAIDIKTGKTIWSYRDNNLFHTTVVGSTVYISAEQSLVALNASTGTKLWKFKTGGFFGAGPNVSASCLVFGDHVIFPTETNVIWGREAIQGHLYSIDAKSGKLD